jgi:hypothetical protein
MNTSSISASRAPHRRSAHVLTLAALFLLTSVQFALAGPPVQSLAAPADARIAIGASTTPGDANHQFKITQPGSYYLATALTGVTGKKGIGILSAGVTLDLNGFSLNGVANGGDGIHIANTHGPVRVFNGILRNWAGSGIHVTNSTVTLETITVSDSSGGISIANTSTVTINRCVAEENLTYGISTTSNGSSVVTVVDTIARANGWSGFSLMHAVVRGCAAYENTGSGFELWSTTAVNCVSQSNGRWGMRVNGTLVSHATVTGNFGDSGIFTTGSCAILESLVVGHTGTNSAGIEVGGSANRVEGNNLVGNSIGLRVTGAVNFIARNTARSLVKNYRIAANNRMGKIVVPTLTGEIDGNVGGGSGATDPWSNIAF